MLFQGQVGALPAAKQTGGNPNVIQGFANELLLSEVFPFYYTLLKNNRIFFQQVTGANATGFTGGAAGTPLIGIYNPQGSGVDLILLRIAIAIRTQGTGAASPGSINLYGGVSALPTGTLTQPVSAYSQLPAGSAARTFVNTALTGSTAIALTAALLGIGANPGTTAPSTGISSIIDYPFGLVCASPGVLQAIGAAASTTAASIDVTAYWAETPA